MNKCLILVIEDDVPIRNLITTTLKSHEYRFTSVGTGAMGIAETASKNPASGYGWSGGY